MSALSKELRESEIEHKVVAYAVKKGWLTRKLCAISHRGMPDRILMKKGCVMFIEFKAPSREPTKRQEREHAVIRGAGHQVYVIDDIEEGKHIIDVYDAAIFCNRGSNNSRVI